jgi:ADP-heptose:LPS heptosyltransferase
MWIASSARPPLRLRGVPSLAPPRLEPARIRQILWVRADAIGDGVLASDQLRGLAEHCPDAALHVVCQESVAGLYAACPCVAAVHPFDRRALRKSASARRGFQKVLRDLRVDLALNSAFSRDTLADALALASEAPVRVAWRGDTARTPASKLRFLEGFYTHILDGAGAPPGELARNGAFLAFLGAGLPDYGPRCWTGDADRAAAAELLRGLDHSRLLAFFPGAQQAVRSYGRYGDALREAFPAQDVTVVALGAEADRAACDRARDQYGGPWRDLCGRTTLPQTAAVLALCPLAFGAETGSAHLAAAAGTPTVVLLGGGHFGRFLPYAPDQSAACLPLACYGCDWRCPFERVHCVTDVEPRLLARALREAWQAGSDAPRLYRAAAGPDYGTPGPVLDPLRAEALARGRWFSL